MPERTPAERQADLMARQLARETKISRSQQTSWWRIALCVLLIFAAFGFAAAAPFGTASGLAVLIIALFAIAVIA